MYKKVAITNRKLCEDLLLQIEKLDKSDYDYIILREKDLTYYEYLKLAEEAIKRSKKIILHTYINACEELNYRRIHLPYRLFLENCEKLKGYSLIGVSTHSKHEAKKVEELGASYVTASHIFATKCKEGLSPMGTAWLKDVCSDVNIDVYALGGIHDYNISECIQAGADGICMMSEAMK